MDLDVLTVRNVRGNCIARPALSLFLYSNKSVHDLGSFAADTVELYLEYVGTEVLKTYVGNNGELRDLTVRRLSRDFRQLRTFPKTLGASWIEYDSDPDGWVGEYGVLLYATDFSRYDHERESDNLLRLDFPPDYWRQRGLEAFIDFVVRISNTFPIESGNAGYSFKRTTGTKGVATGQINRLLPRYLGFDPCYQNVQYSMRGRTFGAHWINLMDDRLSTALGGFNAIAERLSEADVRQIDHGIFVRGSKVPPIGDSNRRAPDIGWLPEVSRVLKPTRVGLTRMGNREFDARQWLARFDDMEVRPWDNLT
jgi:hypothetical protein